MNFPKLLNRIGLAILLIPFVAFYSCNNQSSQEQESSYQIMEVSKVDNFGLYDQHGDFHNLYYYDDSKAIVLYTHGKGCPIVRNALPTLEEVRDEYHEKGVKFFLLNANLQDNRKNIAQEAKDYDIDFPILIDEDQLVAEALQIERTAEAILVDPETWEILYRGPVDDRLHYETQKPEADNRYLADAIDAFLAGEPIAEKRVKSPGCIVPLRDPRELAANVPDYATDIAPILQSVCQQCHVPNGIAPWAMTSYEVVKGWSPMIREVIRTRRMPPWHADPHVNDYQNDISLTSEQRQAIVHWIEAGSPRGEGKDPLKENPPKEIEWALGEPDVIVELDTQLIPATGVLDYRYVEQDIELTEGRWVKAVDVIPGNRAVLHHCLVAVIYPDGHEEPIERDSRWLTGLFASYAPGMEPEVFPEGSGRYLPAGSKLEFQLHYTPTGREEKDATQLGIYFSDRPANKEYMVIGPYSATFEIPPHAKNHPVEATYNFDEPVTLYNMFPHMHFRGKSMKYTAIYPDGTKELLLSVPNYNFNWQRGYKLEDPISLPAGSKILCEATFDNSAQNKYNPEPDKPVYWGEQSFEEMMIGYMSFVKGIDKPANDQLAGRR